MPSLPMNKEQLGNFILNHVHAWSQEYAFVHPDDPQSLAMMMDAEFSSFVIELADKFRNEVLPQFEDAA